METVSVIFTGITYLNQNSETKTHPDSGKPENLVMYGKCYHSESLTVGVWDSSPSTQYFPCCVRGIFL